MKNNPQSNQGIEFDKPTNEVAGAIVARQFIVHNTVDRTSRALYKIVQEELRRAAAEQYNQPMQPAPAESVAPSSTNVLGQAALQEQQQAADVAETNLLTDVTDPDDLEAQQLAAIEQIHAEIAAERLNQGDFDRAA